MSSKVLPQQIRDYWDQSTDLYLPHMTTFQAGLFSQPGTLDPFADNAIEIAKRAGIRPGDRVLDLGCGVCGPAVEIVKAIPSVSFVCVTNCERQVEVARERILKQELTSYIEVTFLDYHEMQSLCGDFDKCLFLESFGYTLSPLELLSSVFEKLKLGGHLYIKDVCHHWHLTSEQAVELCEFNATYCYNTPLLSDVMKNVRANGLSIEMGGVVTDQMYRKHSKQSMFVDPENSSELTEFGRRHFKGFSNLPIDFYEIKARK